MNPAWASCYGDIRGVYDPPIALTQVASAKAPQMTVPILTTSETIDATPASPLSHPAAETSAATVLPDNLPPSVPHDGTVSDAPRPSASTQGVGGLVASILGGAGFPTEGDTSPSSGESQSGAAAAYVGDSLPSSAVDEPEPQASHSSGSGQDVGGVIASIIGGDGHSTGVDASISGHMTQDTPAHEWDSSPTPIVGPENGSHSPSDADRTSDSARQTPIGQASGGQTSMTSQSFAASSNMEDSGTSTDLPEDLSTTTPAKGEPGSTQAGNTDTRPSAFNSNSITDSVSMATIPSPCGAWVICSILLLVSMSSFSMLQGIVW